MRTCLKRFVAAITLGLVALTFTAPAAMAQTYPPTFPAGPTGDEILLQIQANNAAAQAAAAAAQAAAAAAAGNAAGAASAAAAAQAAANRAAALAVQAKNTSVAKVVEAAAAAAKGSAEAAAKSAANVGVPVTSVPAAPVKLAFTGGDVNLPVALGATLVGAGGLALLGANKRSRRQR